MKRVQWIAIATFVATLSVGILGQTDWPAYGHDVGGNAPRVLFSTGDGRLLAMDAKTGTSVATFGKNRRAAHLEFAGTSSASRLPRRSRYCASETTTSAAVSRRTYSSSGKGWDSANGTAIPPARQMSS